MNNSPRLNRLHSGLRISTLMLLMTPALLAVAPLAQAGGAIPTFSQDSQHIVRFNYSPEDVYHIYTRQHMITDLRLAPGEKMEMLALGNTVQWIRANTNGNVFIKPTRPGLTTNGTLVTNLHTYQLILTSSKSANWYQMVSWNQGNVIAMESSSPIPAMQAVKPAPSAKHPVAENTVQNSPQNRGQNQNLKAISNLHFDYKISGHAHFRPSEVFDNGTFTWIKIPNTGNGAMPVVFVRSHGNYVITNYTVKGRYLIVQQVFHKAKLRIGQRVVTITRG